MLLMTPSKSFTSRTAVAFCLPQRCNHREKIDIAFSYCTVGIFSAVVVVNVHVGEAGLEEFGQAVVEIRVAGIKGKAGGLR